ncbi:FAD-dependent oxidoreductase [Streptomyces montanisoli]|uniref:FAD-binding protein n=1 Tax=Streptomyces montanisoli TaxID=2798581 RepID=A0A940S0D0_9ACTN|nr:FAD-binding protein [Streptomyces montanisoli]MBP0460734.1 FAD-binding protein [Streptomyces montanisoli]
MARDDTERRRAEQRQAGQAAVDEPAVDLVVAGAGGGLAGALRAAEAGLSVLVVDPDEQFTRGNNTSMSTAMIPGAGSRWQREAGVEDSPERFLADISAKTHGTADPVLAAALAQLSAPLVEWLADGAGLPLQLVRDFSYPGHSADRLHTVEGRHGSVLLRHLHERVRRAPTIDMLVPARLVDVVTSGVASGAPSGVASGVTTAGTGTNGQGPVCAAVVEYPGGRRETITTRAVLLATNGYGADRARVARHLPGIAAADYHGGQFSRGDALEIGARLGARSAFLDAYQGHAALARRSRTLVGWATIMHGAIMVDAGGARFGDETTGYSEYAAALAARPGARGWIVLDSRIHDLCRSFTDFRETVEAGALVWADDVERLAARTGTPAGALAESLAAQAAGAKAWAGAGAEAWAGAGAEAWAGAGAEAWAGAEAGVGSSGDDPFGRTFFEAPLRPPYAAVEVVPALFHTQGGLQVDGDARVRGGDGAPIPGLYASGGAAHGISGHGAAGYLAGNGLLPALGLAWQAANDVARAVTRHTVTRHTGTLVTGTPEEGTAP